MSPSISGELLLRPSARLFASMLYALPLLSPPSNTSAVGRLFSIPVLSTRRADAWLLSVWLILSSLARFTISSHSIRAIFSGDPRILFDCSRDWMSLSFASCAVRIPLIRSSACWRISSNPLIRVSIIARVSFRTSWMFGSFEVWYFSKSACFCFCRPLISPSIRQVRFHKIDTSSGFILPIPLISGFFIASRVCWWAGFWEYFIVDHMFIISLSCVCMSRSFDFALSITANASVLASSCCPLRSALSDSRYLSRAWLSLSFLWADASISAHIEVSFHASVP